MTDARQAILADAYGFMVTQALGAAARAGVADLVAEGTTSIDGLVAATSLPADSLRRLLRALAALEIFDFDGEQVGNTAKSELLRSDVPGSVRWIAQAFSNEHYRVWASAARSFDSGGAVTEDVLGCAYFDWLGDHPDEAAIFNRAMAAGAVLRNRAVAGLAWSDELVVDVGGGTGRLLADLLAAHPELRGIVVDLPHAKDAALSTIAAAGLADRCTFASGDFFESVPAGGDVYILSNILHDWDDAPARRILRVCRAAASPGARLLVVDAVLPAGGTGAVVPKLLDLHMLVLLGGRERTEDEWRALLAAGGFALERVHTDGPAPMIEAVVPRAGSSTGDAPPLGCPTEL